MKEAKLILVRHTAVIEACKGLCYGSSDVGLSPEGEQRTHTLCERLATHHVSRVMHSGLSRARILAERLAQKLHVLAQNCDALRERDFGSWELMSWQDIHERSPGEMVRVLTEPGTYRPGGGETTYELRDRVMRWFDRLPRDGVTVAVTHGGPIAVLLGTRRNLPVDVWPRLVPSYGAVIELDLSEALEVG